MKCKYFLKEDEQLLVEEATKRYTINGPGIVYVSIFHGKTRRKALTIEKGEYLKIRNNFTGESKVVTGPKLYFLEAAEQMVVRANATKLDSFQYAKISNIETAEEKIIKGPTLFFPEAHEQVMVVENAVNLDPLTYLHVKNKETGLVYNVSGPQLFFPTIHELIVATLTATTLKKNEYCVILNKETGEKRVEKGEKKLFLTPTEMINGVVKEAIHVDEETSVLVRDDMTGQLELVTEKQVFFPKSNQSIIELRKLIRLEDHQAVILKDNNGKYHVKKGSDMERCFFLPPFWEIVEVTWSTGILKDKKALKIQFFNLRHQFTWFDFELRTQDNVELILGITFFWNITDVETMIHMTGDCIGDLCNHTRSKIIQYVSQNTLEKFLSSFNEVAKVVLDPKDNFCTLRGIRVHELEVRYISCKDAGTQKVLQEIIQETTNRLSRIQKQESENEVLMKRIKGEIEGEKMNAELIEIKNKHNKENSSALGKAEAERVKGFFDGLGKELSTQEKLSIFATLRKQEALRDLSMGKTQMFFTPSDVNLSIKSEI